MTNIQEIFRNDLKKLNNMKRIYSINLQKNDIKNYLKKINDVSIRDLDLIPYLRFLVAHEFEKIFNLKNILSNALKEYETGALIINLSNFIASEECYIKLSTALSYLIGIPQLDPLSGKYYSTFTVEHSNNALPHLLRPYETFRMHTDGAYCKKIPDWVAFTKISEKFAAGGESKLLHIDDWEDFHFFHTQSINQSKVCFFATPKPNFAAHRHVTDEKSDLVYCSILHTDKSHKSIRFVDRFIYPQNLQEAQFISDLQHSLEKSKAILEINIPTGSILILNNHYWLHGRKPFEIHNFLSRKLMRQRGYFD